MFYFVKGSFYDLKIRYFDFKTSKYRIKKKEEDK